MASISIQNVSKNYGPLTVLNDFSLEISDGEFVVLVGPSGCGKSTILKILAGLEPATKGKIKIGERDVTDLAPGDRDIAMVFQNYALYPHLTVAQNIGFGLKMRQMHREEIDSRVLEAAKTLALEPYLNRRPKELSGGQRQRVALGRAIVREPLAFMMDEPLSNLDAKLRVHMRAEIGALHKRVGVTTVYVTHDQVEAMTMADRVVIMCDGTIQQIADPDTLYQEPNNLFVASFIGSPGMNFLTAPIELKHGHPTVGVFGARIDLRDHHLRDLDISTRDHLIAGIRPEHINLGEGEINFSTQPTLIESLGSEKYVYFYNDHRAMGLSEDGDDSNNKGLIARVNHKGQFPEAEPVTLSFSADSVYLFDPKTGKLL